MCLCPRPLLACHHRHSFQWLWVEAHPQPLQLIPMEGPSPDHAPAWRGLASVCRPCGFSCFCFICSHSSQSSTVSRALSFYKVLNISCIPILRTANPIPSSATWKGPFSIMRGPRMTEQAQKGHRHARHLLQVTGGLLLGRVFQMILFVAAKHDFPVSLFHSPPCLFQQVISKSWCQVLKSQWES